MVRATGRLTATCVLVFVAVALSFCGTASADPITDGLLPPAPSAMVSVVPSNALTVPAPSRSSRMPSSSLSRSRGLEPSLLSTPSFIPSSSLSASRGSV